MRLIKLAAILILAVSFEVAFGQNNGEKADEKRKCYKCDSSTDENCIKDLSKLTLVECTDAQKFCSAKLDGTKILRDCLEKKEDCTGDKCKACEADGCNNNNVCQNCDSKTDLDCVKLSSTNSKYYQICDKKDTKCLINITNDKTTVRHCASDEDIKSCTNEATCKQCDGVNCNNIIFPTNRRRCYQCKSGADGCTNVSGSDAKIKSEPCPLYVADDQCYMYGETETAISRGCVSDVADDNKCKADSNDTKRCSKCKTDNCNYYNYKRKQDLKCIQCTSTKEDTKCMWAQSENEAKDCKNEIEYFKEDACYTEIKDDQVHRGCLYDRAEDLGECKDKCKSCSDKSACNNKDENIFTCIRCRSNEDKLCYDDADKAKNLDDGKCRNPVTAEMNKCFRGIWNGVVIRGCLVDADERVQATCKANNKQKCEICNSPNCNNMKTTKDGAARLSGVFGFISVLIAILIQLL